MKKFAIFTTALLLLACLVACGKADSELSGTTENTGPSMSVTVNATDDVAGETIENRQTESPEPQQTEAVKEREYTSFMVYEYHPETNLYFCIYLTPETISVWNSDTKPDSNAPQTSADYESGFTASVDAAAFEEIAQAAKTTKFENSISEIRYLYNRSGYYEATLYGSCPDSYICAYDGTDLVKEAGGFGAYHSSQTSVDNTAFFTLHRKIMLLYGSIDIKKATHGQSEQKKISSILLYRYNSYAESSASYGYTFYYFTADQTVMGQTKREPIVVTDPVNTPNLENLTVKTPTEGAFDALCEDLYDLRVDCLPALVHMDSLYAVSDGSVQHIFLFYEDGSVFVSQGYAADSYNLHFKTVYNRLHSYYY